MISRSITFCTFCLFTLLGSQAGAAVVMDVTPDNLTGLAPNATDFLGVVVVGGAGTSVDINTSPTSSSVTLDEALGTIEVNDVVGQDIDNSGGFSVNTTLWTYSIALPNNAQVGTGLTNIAFDADMLFSEAAMNNASADSANRLTFELFLNGSSVGSETHVAPADGEGAITTLTNAGGSSITNAEIRVFSTNSQAFNAGTETFAVTNAVLSASFDATAVPEPSSVFLLFCILGVLGLRRRRSVG